MVKNNNDNNEQCACTRTVRYKTVFGRKIPMVLLCGEELLLGTFLAKFLNVSNLEEILIAKNIPYKPIDSLSELRELHPLLKSTNFVVPYNSVVKYLSPKSPNKRSRDGDDLEAEKKKKKKKNATSPAHTRSPKRTALHTSSNDKKSPTYSPPLEGNQILLQEISQFLMPRQVSRIHSKKILKKHEIVQQFYEFPDISDFSLEITPFLSLERQPSRDSSSTHYFENQDVKNPPMDAGDDHNLESVSLYSVMNAQIDNDTDCSSKNDLTMLVYSDLEADSFEFLCDQTLTNSDESYDMKSEDVSVDYKYEPDELSENLMDCPDRKLGHFNSL